ncbi:hypothetical protein [uncultured Idiomarina sp.]|uniref:hypothetical protein n=1 Tax=uncultured Idiomarina sp. TaxID=352961 RepID=UPI002594C65B|nr:hypothetical protein [uncultured Idiomarina sp.]
MDIYEREVIDVPFKSIIIHPLAQPAYEYELDLLRQCTQKIQVYSSNQQLQFDYPQAVELDNYYQVISGWSHYLSTSHDIDEELSIVRVSEIPPSEISNLAWRYVISRVLNQVHHATYCLQLRMALEQSPFSHSDIEALTGVSAKTVSAIARKLSQTSLSTSKRQLTRLNEEYMKNIGGQL